MEKKFNREEYPIDILNEYGLTESMVYDLPGVVHDTLESGGKSPVLPIRVSQKFGYIQCYARIRIIETHDGLDVMFMPRLSTMPAQMSQFTEKERSLLLSGKTIVADVQDEVIAEDGTRSKEMVKSFVQYDPYTRNIIYNPTQIIGKNLAAICNEYELTGDQLERLREGDLITIIEENEEGVSEPVTIGVDLFSENGTVVVAGDETTYHHIVAGQLPTYNFGNDGCWVNSDGILKYVEEDEFTPDIYEELERRQARHKAGTYKVDMQREPHANLMADQEETHQLAR